MADAAHDYQGHYLTAGRGVAWTVIAVCAFSAVDLLRSGQGGASLPALAVLGATVLVSYDLGLRPAVLEQVEGVCVRNPLRTCLIPWGSVTSVDVTDVLRLHCQDLVVRCFAIPRRRPRPRIAALGPGRPMSGMGSFEPAGASASRHPTLPRAEMVAQRLRSRAEAATKGAGVPVQAPRVAADAAWVLAAAAALLVVAAAL